MAISQAANQSGFYYMPSYNIIVGVGLRFGQRSATEIRRKTSMTHVSMKARLALRVAFFSPSTADCGHDAGIILWVARGQAPSRIGSIPSYNHKSARVSWRGMAAATLWTS